MKKYTANEIEIFLKTIDKFLNKKVEVIIIGGTAAALAYKVTAATQDIDTWNSTNNLSAACKKAREETGMDIPLEKVGVADGPYHFEDRLQLFKPEMFTHLVVKLPEAADLILMKMLRSYAHDLDAIEEMVKSQKVTAETLIQRYTSEMSVVVGNKEVIDINFLAMIERCFGEKAARDAQKRLKA